MDRIRRNELKERISSRMRDLTSRCGVSGLSLAKGIGIPYTTFIKMLRGDLLPSLEVVLAVADYFAVPLDYFFGRCDEETSKRILENFPECFMKLRRASYEDYLEVKKRIYSKDFKERPGKYDVPFPYNILLVLGEHQSSGKVNSAQMNRLQEVWGKQKPRYAEILSAYYKDGRTLSDIGKEYGISKEAVRQTIVHAIRALRYLYGSENL